MVIHRPRHRLKTLKKKNFQPSAIRFCLVDGTGIGHLHHLENNRSLYRSLPSCSMCYHTWLAVEKRNCACGVPTLGQHVKKVTLANPDLSLTSAGESFAFLKSLLLLNSFHLFLIFCSFFFLENICKEFIVQGFLMTVQSRRGEFSFHFWGGGKKKKETLAFSTRRD